MAIPGSRAQAEIFGKVRVGEKRGKYAASLDYFRSDKPEFAAVVGEKPKSIKVRLLADAPEDAFRTGLNWWVQKGDKPPVLACYTEESGSSPVALRVEAYLDRDDAGEVLNEARGEKVGAGRVPITCPFRDCPHFKSRDCRPIGRLDFKLADDPSGRVWRLETKGWNSIESLENVLATYNNDLTDYVFELSVEFQSKGNKRFPVLTITEVDVDVNTPADVDRAQALVDLLARCEAAPNEDAKKAALCTYLDTTQHGWRQNAELVAKLRKIGVDQAVQNIYDRAAK